jgi:hypothetical protein
MRRLKLTNRGTCPLAGVFWDSERLKWRAQATVAGRRVHLGRFETIEEAAAAMSTLESLRKLLSKGATHD